MEERQTTSRPCPVCGTRSGFTLRKLFYALFDDLEIPGEKTLTQCNQCSMRFDDLGFTETQLQNYYRRNEHYAASPFGGSGGITEANRARYDRIIDSIQPCQDGIILDYGSGQGGFVARCRSRGLNAAGIEPSEKSREVGKANNLEIFSSLEAFRAGCVQKKIQAVVLSHVLEHLINPRIVLMELSQRFPGARVYLEVPDATSYLPPLRMRWSELYFEHLSHFEYFDLKSLAASSGIEVKEGGATQFSPIQPDVHCLFLTGNLGSSSVHKSPDTRFIDPTQRLLPEIPGGQITPGTAPLALWGVSQYAMLLIGSRGLLPRLRRLFDASPAKIGRHIGMVRIDHPENIRTLSSDFTLLLPVSPYLEQMKAILSTKCHFEGTVLEI